MSRTGYEEMVVSAVKDFSKGSKVGKDYLEDVALALKDRWDDFKKDLDLQEVEAKKITPSPKATKKTTQVKKKAVKKSK